jgi:hypothetical protein
MTPLIFPHLGALYNKVFHPKKWVLQHLGYKLCSTYSSFESHRYRLTDTSRKFIRDEVMLETALHGWQVYNIDTMLTLEITPV